MDTVADIRRYRKMINDFYFAMAFYNAEHLGNYIERHSVKMPSYYAAMEVLSVDDVPSNMHVTLWYKDDCTENELEYAKLMLPTYFDGYERTFYVRIFEKWGNLQVGVLDCANICFDVLSLRLFNRDFSYRRDVDEQYVYKPHMTFGKLKKEKEPVDKEWFQNISWLERHSVHQSFNYVTLKRGRIYVKNMDMKEKVYL